MMKGDGVLAIATPAQNTPAKVALGFNVARASDGKSAVGAQSSPTALVNAARDVFRDVGGEEDGSGSSTSLLNANELTVPNHDIRVMLANGASKPVEVLRSHVVTSLTLSMKPEWFTKNRHVFTRSSRLLLGESSLPDHVTREEVHSKLDDPDEYREVVMRLADLQYIRVKAVVNVNEAGDIDEREYWLPLNKSQTIGEIKRLVATADDLESAKERLLSDVDTASGMSMVLRGKELSNSSTIESEGLEHNALVHLYVKRDANVNVALRSNSELEIRLNVDQTADSFRSKLNVVKAGSLDSSRFHTRSGSMSMYNATGSLRSGPLSSYGGRGDGGALELRPHVPRSSPRAGTNSMAIPSPHAHSFGASSFGGRSLMHSSWAARASLNSYKSQRSGTSNDSVSPPSAPITPFGSPGTLAHSFDLAREGLLMGNAPQLSQGGNGGAYFLKGVDGKTAAVFKPADEEPFAPNNPRGHRTSHNGEGMRKGTKAGEGAAREVAAYLLDHGGFAGVPATSLANLTDSVEDDGKLGSLQEYVENTAEAEEFGPSMFPCEEVHKITILDIRLANTDRNAGNILVQSDEDGKIVRLIPIDHGYALPHTLEDVCFEWEFWPQANMPYSDDVKEYVAMLDADEDIAYLRENDIELDAAPERVLRVCTALLKEAVPRNFRAADIASMLNRKMPNRKSDIEKIAAQAASTAIAEGRSERGLLVHKSPENGSFWNDLAGDEVAEKRFMSRFTKLLIDYLDNMVPEHELAAK
jgi:phosphatidylinositol 4-kinase type 2|uniref:1-phosphatidylinositol 4-kinase n=1 Tax=Ostreococcus mediterraneus TaxID=1486918 RepID=A0A7S0KLP1_9CHLO|mmetsp:Transcript_6857/g.24955  ORF Transcript_6857/g.24955 Transcript_6857/m.24955 type:complete len:756 (+) Transcript_6857:3356-5623(+)